MAVCARLDWQVLPSAENETKLILEQQNIGAAAASTQSVEEQTANGVPLTGTSSGFDCWRCLSLFMVPAEAQGHRATSTLKLMADEHMRSKTASQRQGEWISDETHY